MKKKISGIIATLALSLCAAAGLSATNSTALADSPWDVPCPIVVPGGN